MKRLVLFLVLLALIIPGHKVFTDGLSEEEWEEIERGKIEKIPKERPTWVYGKIEYLHDVLSPCEYLMILRGHPKAKIPKITGGYATTDVYVKVKLRGISVPHALQDAQDRNRPHIWLERQRERWDEAMRYIWNIMQPQRTFRVGNFKVIKDDELLEADIEFLLGGQWHSLNIAMMQDEHGRPTGAEWDWGSRIVSFTNPNIPK